MDFEWRHLWLFLGYMYIVYLQGRATDKLRDQVIQLQARVWELEQKGK